MKTRKWYLHQLLMFILYVGFFVTLVSIIATVVGE